MDLDKKYAKKFQEYTIRRIIYTETPLRGHEDTGMYMPLSHNGLNEIT